MTVKNKTYLQNGISWDEAGAGDTVLFLHAMAGSKTAWRPQFKKFSSEYRCVAWDLPGFGESDLLETNAGMERLVEVLKTFITESLGVNSCHIVGLSVGGMIAQHFTAKYPEHVKTIVIADTSPKFGLSGGDSPAEFLGPIKAQLNEDETVVPFCTGMINALVGPHCSDALKAEATESMSRGSAAGLIFAASLIADHDAVGKLKHISAPTLVLVGADDVATPLAYSEYLTENITGASLSVIKRAGHISNLENPEQFNVELAGFLTSVEG